MFSKINVLGEKMYAGKVTKYPGGYVIMQFENESLDTGWFELEEGDTIDVAMEYFGAVQLSKWGVEYSEYQDVWLTTCRFGFPLDSEACN